MEIHSRRKFKSKKFSKDSSLWNQKLFGEDGVRFWILHALFSSEIMLEYTVQ